jgi:hypothetical protein
MPKNYAYDPNMPPRRVTRLQKVKRVRPYDYRRDGAVGNPVPHPYGGGIFGQPVSPASHTGIFEDRWALPHYVEQAELRGGPLQYNTLRADPTMSDPIERGITVPDLGSDEPEPSMLRKLAKPALLAWWLFGK